MNPSKILQYIKNKYGIEADYPFDSETYATTPVFRKPSGKWFGIMMRVRASVIGRQGDEMLDIINLKNEPMLIDGMVDGVSRLRAYHMNKQHWITIVLDGKVDAGEICDLIDESYNIVK